MNHPSLLIDLLKQLGLAVPGESIEPLLQFMDELLRWNRKVNLTAITDPEQALEKHLVDSLTLLPLVERGERLLDVGSGGGFPGIPIKITCPALEVVTVDAVAKKINFQRHAARILKLEGFRALHARIEDLPRVHGMAAYFDVVVSRAFASLTDFADLALPCLAPEGRLVAMKGAEGEAELRRAESALSDLGLKTVAVRQLRLPLSGGERTLITLAR